MRICAPIAKPPKPVPIDEPSWNQRRVRRSLKNVFQSRTSVSAVLEEWEEDGEERVLAVDAERVDGDACLNETLRL